MVTRTATGEGWASKRCQVVEGGDVQVAGFPRYLRDRPANQGGSTGLRRAGGAGWTGLGVVSAEGARLRRFAPPVKVV
jgi:hypothetical protein